MEYALSASLRKIMSRFEFKSDHFTTTVVSEAKPLVVARQSYMGVLNGALSLAKKELHEASKQLQSDLDNFYNHGGSENKVRQSWAKHAEIEHVSRSIHRMNPNACSRSSKCNYVTIFTTKTIWSM